MLRNPARLVVGVNLALFFAFALWCRVTSLGTAPDPSADEAFFGAQAENLLRGRTAASKTPTRKPVDPVYTLATIPLTRAFGPSSLVERAPAVAFGLLAPLLLAGLGPRFLGRTSARIAAGMLAALPIAIMYTRIGWEYAEVPLYGLAIAGCAWRAGESRRAAIGLVVAFWGCLTIAPTTIFLAPVPLAILAGRWLMGEDRAIRRPMIAGAAVAALTVGLGLHHRAGSTAKATFEAWKFGSVDWPRFLTLYLRHHLGFCQGIPSTETGPALFRACWGIVAAIVVLGTWSLARRRAWDRLAIVVGALAAATGYHLAVGPDGFHPSMPRYALFLVVPNCLAAGCLLESLLVEPTSARRRAARWGQSAAILGLGWALMIGFRVGFFAEFERASTAGESFWTLRTEGVEPMKRVAAILARDLDGRPVAAEPRVLAAETWWVDKPLEYYLAPRDDVRVASLHDLGPRRRQNAARRALSEGGYAVCTLGDGVDWAVQTGFPGERLRHWSVGPTVIYRLRDEGEGLAARATRVRR